MRKYTLTAEYQRIFENRIVIITGVSRSGTSILGRITGSFRNVEYLFQPTIIRLLPTLAGEGLTDFEFSSQLLKGILFEDYYLQLLHGRNVNFKRSDMSFIGRYQDLRSVKKRWLKYERREDVLGDIFKGQYIFVVKINGIHSLLPTLEKMFKGMKVVNIVRNGNDVISSSIKRGWYTDEWLNYHMVEWMRPGRVRVPWFIPAEDADKFCAWNSETRVAYIWRIFTAATSYYKNKSNYLELRYEDLIENPERITKVCEEFMGEQRTEVTFKNIEAVKGHTVTQHPDQSDKIEMEERILFKKIMEELNYL